MLVVQTVADLALGAGARLVLGLERDSGLVLGVDTVAGVVFGVVKAR